MQLKFGNNSILYVPTFIVIFAHLFFVNYYSVNFPNSDDFDQYIQFLLSFKNASSYYDRILILFTPRDEHFQFLSRAITILTYYLSNQINFSFIIFLGSLAIIPLILFFYFSLESIPVRSKQIVLFCVALIIAQPTYVEATQWATNSIHFLWINPLALASFFYALNPVKPSTKKAFLLATLACLTQGNGIFVPAIIATVKLSQQKWREFVYFGILTSSIFTLFIYLGPTNETFTKLTSTQIVPSIIYIFQFLGSSVGFNDSNISLLTGILSAILLISALKNSRLKSHLPLIGFIVFILASAMINSISRGIENLSFAYTTSRYSLLSSLFICSVLVLFITSFQSELKRKVTVAAFFTVGLLFFCNSYWLNFDQYKLRYETLNDSRDQWKLFNTGLLYFDQLRAKDLMHQAERERIVSYELVNLPQITELEIIPQSNSKLSKCPKARLVLEKVQMENDNLILSGWYSLNFSPKASPRVFLKLEQKNSSTLASALLSSRKRPDVSNHLFQTGKSAEFIDGFFGIINIRGYNLTDSSTVYIEVVSSECTITKDINNKLST